MDADSVTRALLWCGIVGPVAFVFLFLVFGATRPHYDPVRTFVSQLSLDGGGWMQKANFIVSGLLIVIFGVGVSRQFQAALASTWCWIPVAFIGVGVVGLGIFDDDPALGYPPPDAPAGIRWPATWHAWGHLASGIVTLSALLFAIGFFAWSFAREGNGYGYGLSVACAILMPVFYVAALASANASSTPGDKLGGKAGLFQRASLITLMAWVVLLALSLLSPATTTG